MPSDYYRSNYNEHGVRHSRSTQPIHEAFVSLERAERRMAEWKKRKPIVEAVIEELNGHCPPEEP